MHLPYKIEIWVVQEEAASSGGVYDAFEKINVGYALSSQ